VGLTRRQLERTLATLQPLSAPKAALEQYATPADVVAWILWEAWGRGEVQGRRVLDLGCGQGSFAIGAALLDARAVVGVDVDPAAIEVARANAEGLGLAIEFRSADVRSVAGRFDVVFQNPPFGAQRRRADRAFVETAIRVAPVVYTLHPAQTTPFLHRLFRALGAQPTLEQTFKLPIPYAFPFHRQRSVAVAVTLFRLQRQG